MEKYETGTNIKKGQACYVGDDGKVYPLISEREKWRLDPCPFCGSDEIDFYRPFASDFWIVACAGCDIEVVYYGDGSKDKLKALSAWNRRVDDDK